MFDFDGCRRQGPLVVGFGMDEGGTDGNVPAKLGAPDAWEHPDPSSPAEQRMGLTCPRSGPRPARCDEPVVSTLVPVLAPDLAPALAPDLAPVLAPDLARLGNVHWRCAHRRGFLLPRPLPWGFPTWIGAVTELKLSLKSTAP